MWLLLLLMIGGMESHLEPQCKYDCGRHPSLNRLSSWETSPQNSKKPFTLASKANKKWAENSQDLLAEWLAESEYGTVPSFSFLMGQGAELESSC
jgi:hypothetical protein